MNELRQAAALFKFEHFGEPELLNGLAAAWVFWERCSKEAQGEGAWLSLFGRSGTGKTHLALRLAELAKGTPDLAWHPTLVSGVHFYVWPDILNQLKDGDWTLRGRLRDANFLVLDDIGASRATGFALDELYAVLSSRERKWTVLTSNLLRRDIAHELDVRIASRVTRHGSLFVEFRTTPDYSVRAVVMERASDSMRRMVEERLRNGEV